MQWHGQWQPPTDQVLYDRYFKGVRYGVFVEAGACDGILESNCLVFERECSWTGVNVEPDPVLFGLLQANRPDAVNVRAALSDTAGRAAFTKAIHPMHGERFGNGSLRHTAEHRADLVEQGCTLLTFDVPTMTYAALMAATPPVSVDLLSLDVEGNELAVLRGMQDAPRPRVMCIEHANVGLVHLDDAAARLGYRRDYVHFNNAFYIQ